MSAELAVWIEEDEMESGPKKSASFSRYCRAMDVTESRKRPPTEHIDGYVAKKRHIEVEYGLRSAQKTV